MSREDDFFGDFNESLDDIDTGQEDTSEPLMDESPGEMEHEPALEEPERPAAPTARPKPKAKKKATAKPKAKAKKKKASKTTRKPAPKKTAKKKATTAKKKKSARPKPKK
jgi:hypothetical protein